MLNIFLSYSREDVATVREIARLLRRVYGYKHVWFAEELDSTEEAWRDVLDRIAACDLFLYLLSRESLESQRCQDEVAEAKRLQKHVIPIAVRLVPQQAQPLLQAALDDLRSELQMVDMLDMASPDAANDLHAAILRFFELIPKPLPQSVRLQPRLLPDGPLPLQQPAEVTSVDEYGNWFRLVDFRVPANREGGVNTRVLLQLGDHLVISARGVVTTDEHNTPADPDGLPLRRSLARAYRTRGQAGIAGSLFAWIGDNYVSQNAFLVGKYYEGTVRVEGNLWLAVNDVRGGYTDNRGEFLVTIEVTRE